MNTALASGFVVVSVAFLAACGSTTGESGAVNGGHASLDGRALSDGGLVDSAAREEVAEPERPNDRSIAGMYLHIQTRSLLNPSTAQEVSQYVLGDSTCAGLSLLVPWSYVETSRATYDYTNLEAILAPWRQAKKKIGFVFYSVSESPSWDVNGQYATPAYVLAQSSPAYCADSGVDTDPVPTYWTAGFYDPWFSFIREVTSHYDQDSAITYMRFGIATGGEEVFSGCYPTGLTQGIWQTYNLQVLGFYHTLNTSIQLDYPTNADPNDRSINSLTNVLIRAARCDEYGVMRGSQAWGKQYQSYDGVYHYDSAAPYQVDATGHGIHHGQLAADGPRGWKPDGYGTFPEMMSDALKVGVTVFEVEQEVWSVANNPQDENYASYGDAYRTTLASVADAL